MFLGKVSYEKELATRQVIFERYETRLDRNKLLRCISISVKNYFLFVENYFFVPVYALIYIPLWS